MASNIVFLHVAMLFDGLDQLWPILLVDQPPLITVSLFIAINDPNNEICNFCSFYYAGGLLQYSKTECTCLLKASKSQSLHNYILDVNTSKLFQKWKKLSNA